MVTSDTGSGIQVVESIPNKCYCNQEGWPRLSQSNDACSGSLFDWQSRSPDLNPIEHVWDGLGRAIAQRNPRLNTLQELKAALLEEWALLPQAFIDPLINSMKARCEACIVVHGGHTPY
ncbi:Transposable element Tc1 transposase like protein [Argiope bruennichi]|uniref:Transposable element Tc1 transposase like protein n=1 Tax=Argiope bruennichi TaxID=94029 RepID=A0A8T0FKW2_ARGBR|nr:Transposable element Tc1 transposase like protein [Argiope bruennichi]